jgi:hypothetical protein
MRHSKLSVLFGMIKLAYIQKKNGEFFSEAAYSFWRGCNELGIDVVGFEQDSGIQIPTTIGLTKETVVYGGIGIVRKAFDYLGVRQPTVGELPPPEVLPFYGRRIWATTMLEVREGYEDNRFFFIKPLRDHKAFSGHVTSGTIGTLAQTAGFPNNFEIVASEVVYFRSEYRLFVHNRKIRDSRFYRGDFRYSPDYMVADRFIETFKKPPVAYSLDLGVTMDGKTFVVEINDAFSLGHYGMPHTPYTQMVIDRWEEIVNA